MRKYFLVFIISLFLAPLYGKEFTLNLPFGEKVEETAISHDCVLPVSGPYTKIIYLLCNTVNPEISVKGYNEINFLPGKTNYTLVKIPEVKVTEDEIREVQPVSAETCIDRVKEAERSDYAEDLIYCINIRIPVDLLRSIASLKKGIAEVVEIRYIADRVWRTCRSLAFRIANEESGIYYLCGEAKFYRFILPGFGYLDIKRDRFIHGGEFELPEDDLIAKVPLNHSSNIKNIILNRIQAGENVGFVKLSEFKWIDIEYSYKKEEKCRTITGYGLGEYWGGKALEIPDTCLTPSRIAFNITNIEKIPEGLNIEIFDNGYTCKNADEKLYTPTVSVNRNTGVVNYPLITQGSYARVTDSQKNTVFQCIYGEMAGGLIDYDFPVERLLRDRIIILAPSSSLKRYGVNLNLAKLLFDKQKSGSGSPFVLYIIDYNHPDGYRTIGGEELLQRDKMVNFVNEITYDVPDREFSPVRDLNKILKELDPDQIYKISYITHGYTGKKDQEALLDIAETVSSIRDSQVLFGVLTVNYDSCATTWIPEYIVRPVNCHALNQDTIRAELNWALGY